MNLNYSLNKDDYLQYQLYNASTTESTKKKRLKTWIIVTFIFIILSILFYQADNKLLTYYFIAFSIITLIFYPFYQRNQYKKYYGKFIDETYKNRFDKESNIIFNDMNFETFDFTGESKINYSSLEKIIEISSHFFLKVKNGGTLIIPKSKVENMEKVRIGCTTNFPFLKKFVICKETMTNKEQV
ncbi:YcxB family protein, partial [Mariniflexile sp.]|uniref:YcxB family protein n=1 Tax=Mariniflexile sp. TaxID=1979402 RepID=UPI00404777F0